MALSVLKCYWIFLNINQTPIKHARSLLPQPPSPTPHTKNPFCRAPADRVVSIKDSGFTRPGLGGTVLCLHTVTWPGGGPYLAETVWAGSRERFLALCWNGSNRSREWGLLGRDCPERQQRKILGLYIDWVVPETWMKWEQHHFRCFFKLTFSYYIYLLFSSYFSFN